MKMILTLLMMFVLAITSQAQITSESLNQYDEGFISYNAEGVVSGTDTVYTSQFRLGNSTKLFDVFALASQTNDSIALKIVRQISVLGGWVTDKTIGVDTVKTVKAWADTSSYFNVIHRLAICGVDSNGYRTNFKVKISAKRE